MAHLLHDPAFCLIFFFLARSTLPFLLSVLYLDNPNRASSSSSCSKNGSLITSSPFLILIPFFSLSSVWILIAIGLLPLPSPRLPFFFEISFSFFFHFPFFLPVLCLDLNRNWASSSSFTKASFFLEISFSFFSTPLFSPCPLSASKPPEILFIYHFNFV
jgi:hypothetical protein